MQHHSKPSSTNAVTVFYDGACPLCASEMQHLKKLDRYQRLNLVDIYHTDISHNYPQIDLCKADRVLHGIDSDGSVIVGLDVTHAAWSAVGKGHRTAFLRWPVIRFFADATYLVFARYRHHIAYLMTGKKRCTQCLINTTTPPTANTAHDPL